MSNYIGITKQLRVITKAVVSADYDRGPYESIAAANTAIPSALRAIGKDVIIIEDGEAYMAMWKTGILDENLIPIVTSVSASGVLHIMDDEVVDHEDYFSTTYGGQDVGTKVVDTVHKSIYEKVGVSLWIKTFGVAVGTDIDPEAVIEGINVVNFK
ncbi:hypothetical protein [Wenyingzhuangia sp. 2_MG-2023]|uniref:hypothetical protein n=1 Tax=Wenyingzhuangia sp. 2_MG-2023 TaxID=3062639 RepID=UPI0026E2F9A5|nr:hypothetical protein [Wenyingzhuangia sp. 2_MG-2023]MDO6737084.1 hypothetical protein [Wenyingzhuangia sp. 2_MG-2023]